MTNHLDHLNSPQDLKKLAESELPALAEEIRGFTKEFTSITGGHIGSGMGVVEITIALHYFFEFGERDHLIMDVGHQCYPHKILTGRRDQMGTIRQKDGLSGFPDPKESPFDIVKTGHGGTSLTTAVGMALGLKQAGISNERKVVALIGDAGLQEGVAFEALNYAGTFDQLPLLIVLNDNEHGIGPAVGAIMKYLSMVRSGTIYRSAKGNVKRLVKIMEERSHFMGRMTYDMLDRLRSGVHGLMPQVCPGSLFEALGFFYYGPVDGHDLPTLLHAMEDCRNFKRPVVLHCITTKGKGYSYKQDRLAYHAGAPSKKVTAHLPLEFSCQGGPTYSDVFVDETMKLAEEDPRVVAITAAMLEGTGLVKFREKFPDRCFDVGMAEQHAVGMAQGLALAGRRPVCAIYSTFMQRAFDQLFQEISLINAPVMFCLDRAGLVGPDGATHNGVFDIAYCRIFPNMVVMAPRDGSELRMMMRLAYQHTGPTAIRFPRTNTPLASAELPCAPFDIGKAEILGEGSDGCLLAYGAMVYPALDVAREIFSRLDLKLAVVNARFAKPIDQGILRDMIARQPVVFTLEDHVRAGGFGAAVIEEANALGLDTRKIDVIAIDDKWIDHGQRVESLAAAGLDVASLVSRVERRLLPHRFDLPLRQNAASTSGLAIGTPTTGTPTKRVAAAAELADTAVAEPTVNRERG